MRENAQLSLLEQFQCHRSVINNPTDSFRLKHECSDDDRFMPSAVFPNRIDEQTVEKELRIPERNIPSSRFSLSYCPYRPNDFIDLHILRASLIAKITGSTKPDVLICQDFIAHSEECFSDDLSRVETFVDLGDRASKSAACAVEAAFDILAARLVCYLVLEVGMKLTCLDQLSPFAMYRMEQAVT